VFRRAELMARSTDSEMTEWELASTDHRQRLRHAGHGGLLTRPLADGRLQSANNDFLTWRRDVFVACLLWQFVGCCPQPLQPGNCCTVMHVSAFPCLSESSTQHGARDDSDTRGLLAMTATCS